jgi:hypothetical protein
MLCGQVFSVCEWMLGVGQPKPKSIQCSVAGCLVFVDGWMMLKKD